MANEVKGEFWVTDMAGKRKAFRLSNSAYHESYPVFSPDGKWLAFVSDQSGSAEVYVQAFEADPEPHLSGERHLISRNGAIAIRWPGHGKELFYLGFDSRIYAVPVILSPEPLAGSPVPLSLWMRFVLGVAEGNLWPVCNALTNRWFPAREHSRVQAFWITGFTLGTAIGVPVVTVLILSSGWRGTLVSLSLVSLLPAVLFYFVADWPRKSKGIREQELRDIETGRKPDP